MSVRASLFDLKAFVPQLLASIVENVRKWLSMHIKKNILGKRIKQARSDINLTQSDLAYRIGISAQSISAFESGRIPPSQSYLKKIAQFTHKPLYFFTGQKVAEVVDRLEKLTTELNEIRDIVSQLVEADEDVAHEPKN